MDKLYGGAFVLLPKGDSLQIAQTIVSGEQKDDITIHSSEKIVFDVKGAQAAFELTRIIKAFVGEIVSLQQPGLKVPITCGMANDVDVTDVVSGFREKAFRHILEKKAKQALDVFGQVDTATMMMGLSQDERVLTKTHAAGTVMFHSIGDVFKNGTPLSKRLQVDKRGYGSAEERDVLGLGADMRFTLANLIVGIELLDEVYALLMTDEGAVLKGEILPSDTLKDKVKQLAQRYAQVMSIQFQQRQVGGDSVQRFIQIADQDDIRNVIFVHPELRKIFSSTFLAEAGFKHNVCLKPTWAKPSPPFGDVVATFLADMMDKRDATTPRAVSINHGEEYT